MPHERAKAAKGERALGSAGVANLGGGWEDRGVELVGRAWRAARGGQSRKQRKLDFEELDPKQSKDKPARRRDL